MKDISIEYLGGSGFLVSLGSVGMLFDASTEGPEARILPDEKTLSAFDRLFVFVTHHHEDHFSPEIYELCGENAIYVLGFDIPQPHRGIRMKSGDEQRFGSVLVHAYGSTDEGVSFLVDFAGIKIFHAGDLNLWHWRDDSSISEIEQAERAFYDCVAPIPRETIDVAFFPVDPRQGSMYDAGAGYFVMTVKPKVFIPMHFQGRSEAALRFETTGETEHTKVIALTEAGESVDLSIPDTDESAPDRLLREFIESSEETDAREEKE